MGHYAKVLNAKVVDVIVAEADFFETFVDTSPGNWIKTSYNTRGGVYYTPNTNDPDPDQSKALRKNFASVGDTYDNIKDVFIPKKTFNAQVLNETSCTWELPVAYPTDGHTYMWDDQNNIWEQVSEDE